MLAVPKSSAYLTFSTTFYDYLITSWNLYELYVYWPIHDVSVLLASVIIVGWRTSAQTHLSLCYYNKNV